MKYLLDNLKNSFDFTIRSKFNFSRKNYYEEPKLVNILRDIYYFNVLRNCFSDIAAKNLSVLDIGSKNWEYVNSEYSFFASCADNFTLNGIELDAYRLNSNLYSRYEIAKFYIKNKPSAKYIAGDFMNHNQKYDYIIWILPFITQYPLVKWGLPLKYFKPEKMLLHAYELLKDKGELLIVNQGESEYLIQKQLNQKLGMDARYYGEIEDKFNLFKNKRYCLKIAKN